MPVTLSSDWRRLNKSMVAAGKRMSDTKSLHKKYSIHLVESTVQRFQDQEDPSGKKWKKSARAKEQDGQTLVDKGRLRSSIAKKSSSRNAQAGTNVIYGITHQEGRVIKAKRVKHLKFKIGGSWVSVKKVTIPKREFMGINDADIKELGEITINHLAKAFSR